MINNNIDVSNKIGNLGIEKNNKNIQVSFETKDMLKKLNEDFLISQYYNNIDEEGCNNFDKFLYNNLIA